MRFRLFANTAVLGAAILTTALAAGPAAAQIQVGVSIALPPPIVFVAPPQVVVLPGSNTYFAAGIAQDVYFQGGFWWRPWEGRWYRSSYYDRGWSYYDRTPAFYGSVPGDWRDRYSRHQWEGQQWDYDSRSHQEVEKNWSDWQSSNYWEGRRKSGGKGNQGKSSKAASASRSGSGANSVSQPRSAQQPQAGKSASKSSSKSSAAKAAPASQGNSKGQDKGNGKDKGGGSHGGKSGKH